MSNEDAVQHTVRYRPNGSRRWESPSGGVGICESKKEAERVARAYSRDGHEAEVLDDSFSRVARFRNGHRW